MQVFALWSWQCSQGESRRMWAPLGVPGAPFLPVASLTSMGIVSITELEGKEGQMSEMGGDLGIGKEGCGQVRGLPGEEDWLLQAGQWLSLDWNWVLSLFNVLCVNIGPCDHVQMVRQWVRLWHEPCTRDVKQAPWRTDHTCSKSHFSQSTGLSHFLRSPVERPGTFQVSIHWLVAVPSCNISLQRDRSHLFFIKMRLSQGISPGVAERDRDVGRGLRA